MPGPTKIRHLFTMVVRLLSTRVWERLMLNKLWTRIFRTRETPIRRNHRRRFVPDCESLSERIAPAISATFIPQAQTLLVIGDALNNQLTVSRTVAGAIQVNGGAVPIVGG